MCPIEAYLNPFLGHASASAGIEVILRDSLASGHITDNLML